MWAGRAVFVSSDMNSLRIGVWLFAAIGAAAAQGPAPGVTQDWRDVQARIAWHGTWAGARAAAAASGRPILLVSAAPHCGRVPGMW